MGHALGPDAQAANDSASTKTVDLVVITLPDPASPLPPLYLATQDVTIGAQDYQGALRSMPQITYSSGGNANSGSFTIENISNLYGPLFLTTDRVIDGALVVITRAFQKADGDWEAETPEGLPYELARGILKTQPVDDETVQCTFVVDISDSSVTIGGSAITQHCPKTFNVNGNHPWGGACGWKPSMGGEAGSCDYTNDGPNGCKAHGNTRFGGVPPLTPNAATTASSGSSTGGVAAGGGGGGDDGNGGYGPANNKPLQLDVDLRYPF